MPYTGTPRSRHGFASVPASNNAGTTSACGQTALLLETRARYKSVFVEEAGRLVCFFALEKHVGNENRFQYVKEPFLYPKRLHT